MWLTCDPLSFQDGINLYAYVKNNPLNFIDTTGLFREDFGNFFAGAYRGFVDDFTFGLNGSDVNPYQPDTFAAACGEKVGMLGSWGVGAFMVATEVKLAAVATSNVLRYGGKALSAFANSGLGKRATQAAVSSGNKAMSAAKSCYERVFPVSGAGKNIAQSQLRSSSKNVFPSDPNKLLPELARDAKGHIYPATNLRIRPEQHMMEPGEIFNPRHHGFHYHVETMRNPASGWNITKNVKKFKPEGYTTGSGTGFLPGECFPGS